MQHVRWDAVAKQGNPADQADRAVVEGRRDVAVVQAGRGALRVIGGGHPLAARSALVRVVLPVFLLAAVTTATFATLPVLRDAIAAVPMVAGTPAEAVAAGAGSGQVVTFTAVIDDARRMRSPHRGAPVWYAPVAGSSLLVRTNDPERLRLRPLTVTGQVTTLGALAEDPRLLAALRDGRGAPLAADTPVLVERGLLATALLTGLALLVSWATALASVWLLRWDGTRSPDLRLVKPEPQQDDLAGRPISTPAS